MLEQRDVLKGFYRAYADWLAAGAPEEGAFNRRSGLCNNLWRYARLTGLSENDVPLLNKQMKLQFTSAGLNPNYPFNGTAYDNANRKRYSWEYENERAYLNPDRVKWVLDHCNLQQGDTQ